MRFDLFTLLEWTAGIAFLSALFAASGGTASWTWSFGSMPADDSGVEKWLAENDGRDFQVARSGNSVTLTQSIGVFAGLLPHQEQRPTPP